MSTTHQIPTHVGHQVDLNFTEQEFADLEFAAQAAGFESVGAFVASTTLRATRLRRLRKQGAPSQHSIVIPFFSAANGTGSRLA